MEIVLNNPKGKYLEIISLENLENIDKIFKKISLIEEPIEAKIFAINESINSYELSELKKNFHKNNIRSMCIFSNNRDTILTGKSLKIDSIFARENEVKKKLFLLHSKKKDDILHYGTIRSGERISSNGNLCIIGDVNPGAIVSAKENIYIWGKLRGIAIAGKAGNHKASIASLYLNPLQLRIAEVVAIGPEEKPNNHYPEIALIDNEKIIIKPYILDNKN